MVCPPLTWEVHRAAVVALDHARLGLGEHAGSSEVNLCPQGLDADLVRSLTKTTAN